MISDYLIDNDFPSSWLSSTVEKFACLDEWPLPKFIAQEHHANAKIYPPQKELFTALNATSPENVKIVILGQDPYHGAGQAHGLSFSVKKGVKPPPSLKNIYKEIERDLDIPAAKHGHLSEWAAQGVLLLNTVLTVRAGEAGSHRGQGWEELTNAVIAAINDFDHPVVFMLWGAPAQKKQRLITDPKHLVLKAPHPSPLSAYRGFIGCGHFSKANEFLQDSKQKPIDWQLSD